MKSVEDVVAHPANRALEVRFRCVFQAHVMCSAWIQKLRLIGVRAGVE